MLSVFSLTYRAKEFRPRHVQGSFESRLAPGIEERLEGIKQGITCELNMALGVELSVRAMLDVGSGNA